MEGSASSTSQYLYIFSFTAWNSLRSAASLNKESGISGEVEAAVDINTNANKVYQHNFPRTRLLQRNIQSFTAKEINDYEIDMILMSPPCQPFTRVGLKKDAADNRTCSFLHVLNLFPNLNRRWRYLLVENVKGFENSETCQLLLHTLNNMDFSYQQFILSPSMFSVPNTRNRYYLIAKRRHLHFNFEVQPNVMENFPFSSIPTSSSKDETSKYVKLIQESEVQSGGACYNIGTILEQDKPFNYFDQFNISDKVLNKHAWLLDIVGPQSSRSCCFTKAYGHYVEGTGSVFCSLPPEKISDVFQQIQSCVKNSNEKLEALKELKLRYFTPREVARLMCFPDECFHFPADITIKQCYRLLGNSINVHVVALLILLLTSGDELTFHSR